MTDTFLNKTFKYKEEILKFIKQTSTSKLPLGDISKDNENFVFDGDFKYFLNDSEWSLLYEKLLDQSFEDHIPHDLHLIKNKIYLSGFEKTLYNSLELLLPCLNENKQKYNKKKECKGKPDNLLLYSAVLYEILNQNLKEYTKCIFLVIQDKVLNSLLKNKLSEDFSFEERYTNISHLLGNTLFNTFYSSFSNLNPNKFSKKEEIISFENFWIILYEFYKKNYKTDNKYQYKKEFEEIKSMFKLKFNIECDYDIVFDILAKKILLSGIKAVISEEKQLLFSSIKSQLLNDDDNKSYVLEKYLEDSTNTLIIYIGSLMLEHFINHNIFLQIFKSVKKSKGVAKAKYIKLQHTLVHNIINSSSGFKPFLQDHFIEKYKHSFITKNFNGYDFSVRLRFHNIMKSTHDTLRGKGFFNDDSILKSQPQISNCFFSIDKEFVDSYISFFQTLEGKKYIDFTTEGDKENLMRFLSIYEIDFASIINNEINASIISLIIEYALDFSQNYLVDIKTKLKNKITNINIQKQLCQIIDKITAYKYILKMSLKDVLIYSCFNYFIMPSFFDFRGRRYYLGTSLNIQGYHFLKAFIKPFQKLDLTQNIMSKIKKKLISMTTDKDVIGEIKTLTSNLQYYENKVNTLAFDFIYSHLDSTKVSTEALSALLKNPFNFEEVYTFVLLYAKKKNKTLMLVSFISLEQRNKNTKYNYSNCYSFDMVTSGYQMLSLLYGNKTLAQNANLIGTEHTDIYYNTSLAFYKNIEYCLDFIPLCAKSLGIDLEDIINGTPRENNDIKNIFISFVNEKDKTFIKSPLLLAGYLKDLADDNTFSKNILNINTSKIYWISYNKSFLNITKNKILNRIVLRLRSCFILYKLLKVNKKLIESNIFLNRNLFKRIIMIQIYGGTREGRKKAFNDYIKDYLLEQGLSNTINFKSLNDLFKYVDSFFVSYSKYHFNSLNNLTELGKLLSKKCNLVKIKNKNFTSLLAPLTFKVRARRLTVRRLNGAKPYQIDLSQIKFYHQNDIENWDSLNLKINKQKQATTFPPNFIHSMDSTLVQEGIIITHEFSEILKTRLSFYSTHDNYSLGKLLLPIIPIIMKILYRNLYMYKYLKTLKSNFSEEEFESLIFNIEKGLNSLDISNPNFIKLG